MNHQFQVIVIGSGSAGKDAALLAGRAGLRTVLIEAGGTLGGVSLHRGVYAVRALRACATHYEGTKRGSRLGTSIDLVESGWADWLTVQRRTSRRLTEGLGRALDRAKVEVKFGHARLLAPNEVLIEDGQGPAERVSAPHVILATGSRPAYAGQEQAGVLNSDQFLKNTTVPKHLLVIGGGYVGCEFAAIHRALGTRVTLVEAEGRLLPSWDEEASHHFERLLKDAGIEVLLHTQLEPPAGPLSEPPRFRLGDGTVVRPDLTLVATGRSPNVEGLGLEAIGLAETGFIPVNERMQTRVESVFAIGDVNGLGLLDSMASAQARVAVKTILGISAWFDPHWVPRCLHTDPPLAAAGWTAELANAAGLACETLSETLQLVTDDDRTVIEPEATKLKLVVQADTARILGCLAIGPRAAEIVNLASAGLRHGLTARQLADLSPVHPSASEALVQMLQERFDRVH